MDWKFNKLRKKILSEEKNFFNVKYGAIIRVALIYPNDYFIGMSSLGYQIIYELLNSQENVSCERFFISENGPVERDLFSIETGTPLGNYDIIAFSISFELDYIRVVKTISRLGLPLYSFHRENAFPLVIAGGAFSFYNPEPLAPFLDSIILGEGEMVIGKIIKLFSEFKKANNNDRELLLHKLSLIPGIYIPEIYSVSYSSNGSFNKIEPYPELTRTVLKDIDSFKGCSCIITPGTEFGNMFLLEIARGCRNRCAFCMVGNCFKPYRARKIDKIKSLMDFGREYTYFMGFIAPNVGDYEEIDELCNYAIELKLKISFSSIKADSLSKKILQALTFSGQKTITFAPETGNDRLRNLCFKGTTNDDYFRAVELSLKEGIRNIRLYFMIGLPGETDEDINDLVDFITGIYNFMDKYPGVSLAVNINQFIPKPGTHFQRFPLEEMSSIENKISLLKKKLKNIRNLKLRIESAKWSFVQALLAQGDRRVSRIIFLISQYEKENFQSWRKALEDFGVDNYSYVYRKKNIDECLPWGHIVK